MALVDRTAYPRLPRAVAARELAEVFTPTCEEVSWARAKSTTDQHCLTLLVLLKCYQRLGYFLRPEQIPAEVAEHVRDCAALTSAELVIDYDSARLVKWYREFIREWVGATGMVAITADRLQSGTLQDLLEVYGGVDSGRLIIVGGPGAGKTSAAIRLLLDALRHREALETARERARTPVPVLVTLQGWDPNRERFADWLANQLTRDYEFLTAREYGPNAAARFIGGGYLTAILDGLDEIPETLRSAVLRALDEQATFRLVVLTRTKELVDAVSDA